jgi:hypothetical protein
MVAKYKDLKGEITVDLEGVHSPLEEKLKEFIDVDLHQDDFIIGIKLNMGEYHHAHGRDLPSCFITIKVINFNSKEKKEEDRKVKYIEKTIDGKDFFKLFKRLTIELSR